MSTLKTTVTKAELKNTLADYDIYLSAAAPPQNLLEAPAENPPWWPSHYHAIPPYRPVNYSLDPAERPNGASIPEYIFVNVMLNGVRLNSFFVTSYERTAGRWYPELSRYKIGGEW